MGGDMAAALALGGVIGGRETVLLDGFVVVVGAGDVALLGDCGIDELTHGLAQKWAVTGVPDSGGGNGWWW